MGLVVTAGQLHEKRFFEALMDQGALARRGPGRPKLCPGRIVGDKRCSNPCVRKWGSHHIRVTIPRRGNQPRGGPFNNEIYRQRNLVERLLNRRKQFRRLATCYDQLGDTFGIMWVIAAIILWP
jgi:transposase